MKRGKEKDLFGLRYGINSFLLQELASVEIHISGVGSISSSICFFFMLFVSADNKFGILLKEKENFKR